ncbi:MAG: redox-regulated ATPase YchF [Gammaproteobacteria bacterium]|nr:redox-regulated ATPase YchF [Gammaproteobacteria bacterium]
MKAAIIGLPNVGKSTLFNALAAAQVPTENRPFCTIDPNVARVPIPDPRLDAVAQAAGMQRIVQATLELVDVAGLVKGASRGEGLGNRFLAQVREADAAVHLLRCFESGRVTHVTGAVDPVDDAETVNTELALADLATIERAMDSARRRAKSGDPDLKKRVQELEAVHEHLAGHGVPAPGKESVASRRPAPPPPPADAPALLTAIPTLYALNVAEEHLAEGGPADQAEQYAAQHGKPAVRVTAQLESELAALAPDEQQDLRNGLGLPHEILERFMQALRTLLNLNTFFTAGPSEARAWLIPNGATAHYAAGRVHTDFQQRFVRAEVTPWREFVRSPQPQPELKGRGYEVKDGDVLRFRGG